jgi:hypothetical protein
MDFQALIFIAFALLGAGLVTKWKIYELVWSDFLLTLTKAGRAEIADQNRDKHFWDSGIVVASFVVALVLFQLVFRFDIQVDRIPVWGYGASGGLLALVVNAVREANYNRKGGGYTDSNGQWHDEVPFDWGDVRFGTYGGLLVGLAIGEIISVIIKYIIK